MSKGVHVCMQMQSFNGQEKVRTILTSTATHHYRNLKWCYSLTSSYTYHAIFTRCWKLKTVWQWGGL